MKMEVCKNKGNEGREWSVNAVFFSMQGLMKKRDKSVLFVCKNPYKTRLLLAYWL